MSNQIATVEVPEVFENFTVAREFSRKTKSGVVHGTKVRTILGVLSSGNKAEREAATVGQAATLWGNKNYGPIITEFIRVFNLNIVAINERIAKKIAAKPDTPWIQFDLALPNKKMAKQAITLAMNGTDPDFATGEKAIYCAVAAKINALEDAIQAKLAAPAPQAA